MEKRLLLTPLRRVGTPEEIAKTVATSGEVDEELQHLMAVLAT